MADFPSYLNTYSNGLLDDRLEKLATLGAPCMLCPRKCMADRPSGDPGYCRAPYELYISSAAPHFGEESPLTGTGGSGTIFLTHCNLRCAFCQNYGISILGEGISCSSPSLSDVMINLQDRGCHNINFVTPTHYVPQIIKALPTAIEKGLRVPLVYNTGGYDSIEVIKLLDGIFDIYMPDIKFLDTSLSSKYCRADDYPDIVSGVVREMYRQTGDLVMDERGIATRGLIIRHLMMPSCFKDTCAVLDFIAREISMHSYVNIMSQYHPCHRADEFPEISHGITVKELEEALSYARSIGLTRACRY